MVALIKELAAVFAFDCHRQDCLPTKWARLGLVGNTVGPNAWYFRQGDFSVAVRTSYFLAQKFNWNSELLTAVRALKTCLRHDCFITRLVFLIS